MAKVGSFGITLIISCLFMSTCNVYARKLFTSNVYAKEHDLDKEEITFLRGGGPKVAKLTLYVHDLRVGNKNPTVFEVAKASVTASSRTNFGSVHVIDDLVTSGPAINSKAIARSQGLTTSADMAVMGIALNLNIVFMTGDLNGSTISIIGRNQVQNAQRELSVVGGTGVFRFARGYAIQSTVSYDDKTKYGVFKLVIYTTYNANINESYDVEIAEM